MSIGTQHGRTLCLLIKIYPSACIGLLLLYYCMTWHYSVQRSPSPPTLAVALVILFSVQTLMKQ
ncbi:hypothetical protein BDV18DRAFT_135807 [Aspergillus unguis]